MKYMGPFKKYPLFTSNDIEESEMLISNNLSDVSILNNSVRDHFQIRMSRIELGKISLNYSFFRNNTTLKAELADDYFHILISGGKPSMFQLGKKLITTSAGEGAILETDKLTNIKRSDNSEVITLKVPRVDVLNHIEKLTGQFHKGPLVFENRINFTSANGALLDRMLDYIIQELTYDDLLLANPGQIRSLNHMLLSAIVSLPHNKLAQLIENKGNSIAPAIVRRAEEYMKAHLDEPITIIDLLRICGSSRPVLFSAFQNARGYTPMEFLTEQRLQCARENLLHPLETDTVSTIATRCEVGNLGRFAQNYRIRFGELPSVTLRKSDKK